MGVVTQSPCLWGLEVSGENKARPHKNSFHSIRKLGHVTDQSVEAGVSDWLCPVPLLLSLTSHPSPL